MTAGPDRHIGRCGYRRYDRPRDANAAALGGRSTSRYASGAPALGVLPLKTYCYVIFTFFNNFFVRCTKFRNLRNIHMLELGGACSGFDGYAGAWDV